MPPSGCWLTRRWVKRCSASTAKPLAAWPPTAVRGTRVVHFTSGARRSSGDGEPGSEVGLDGDRLRVVAAEVGGVDDEPAHHAGGAEAYEGPVVVLVGGVRLGGARTAPAAGLPAVHDLALVAEALGVELGGLRLEQVLALGEELVVGGDDTGAEPPVGEVDEVGEGEVGGAVVGVRVAAPVRARVAGEAAVSPSWSVVSFRGVGRWVRRVRRRPRSALPRSQVDLHDAVQGLPGVGGDLVAV